MSDKKAIVHKNLVIEVREPGLLAEIMASRKKPCARS
jgi:hypothetical protein